LDFEFPRMGLVPVNHFDQAPVDLRAPQQQTILPV
jgi:hypothetical protein